MLTLFPKMPFKCILLLLTILVLLCRVGTFIFSPLWLDAFKINSNSTNETNTSNSLALVDGVDPYFVVLSQSMLATAVFGLALGALCVFRPVEQTYSDVERHYPKVNFAFAGFSMAISSCIVNFSLSGTRSAPFLIALFGNFIVPIQFITRFLIIGRKPTRRKLICAAVVVGAEFLCLLPTIFPKLESGSEHKEEGGASGIAGILWPLSYVLGLIPGTMTNAFMERSVKDVGTKPGTHGSAFDLTQINMAYYLFCFSFSFMIFTLGLFWLDLLPVYGTCESSVSIFLHRLHFNFACLFGQGCSAWVVCFGWAVLGFNMMYLFVNAYLLRYSEGSNYMVVVMTLRSPILFLFWTLFDESPFKWHPHTSLSTWLSILTLVIMIPAVYLYNTGQPEITAEISTRYVDADEDEDERSPLLGSSSVFSSESDRRSARRHIQKHPSASSTDWVYESRNSLS